MKYSSEIGDTIKQALQDHCDNCNDCVTARTGLETNSDLCVLINSHH